MKNLKNSCSRNFSHRPKMGIFQKNLCKSGLQQDLLNSVACSSHLIFTTILRQHYSNLPQWETTFERGQLTGTRTHQKTLTPCFGDGVSSKFPGDAVGPQVTFWGALLSRVTKGVSCNRKKGTNNRQDNEQKRPNFSLSPSQKDKHAYGLLGLFIQRRSGEMLAH